MAMRSSKQHEATCLQTEVGEPWEAEVLSTGTKGFGSPNPSWNPGDCDSKPHPPGMEGQGCLGISTRDCHCPRSWDPGNSFSRFQQHFFRRKRLEDVPPIQEVVIPVRHSLKKTTHTFCKLWKSIRCLVLAVIGLVSFCLIQVSGDNMIMSQSTCTWFNQY